MEEDRIKKPSEVKSVRVQRFNELNHLLRRRSKFFKKLLGRRAVIFNKWEEYFYNGDESKLTYLEPKERLHDVHNIGGINLDQSQNLAVNNVDAPISFVVGPAGTGKTSVIAAITQKIIKSGGSVLLTAETNIAVKRMYESLQENNILPHIHKDLFVSYSLLAP